MGTLWFWIVAVMLAAYVVLDGFDLGVGIVYLFVTKTEDERGQALRAIGPVWDGNEVWLLAAGGTLFFAFPLLYASSFSGFYLPLMIVLWLLILRGISVELRGHSHDPLWKTFFDGVFAVFERAAGDFLWGGAGECGAGRSDRRRRLLLSAAVDELADRAEAWDSRLVYGDGRSAGAGRAGAAWGAVSRDEDGSGSRSKSTRDGRQAMACGSSCHPRQSPCHRYCTPAFTGQLPQVPDCFSCPGDCCSKSAHGLAF